MGPPGTVYAAGRHKYDFAIMPNQGRPRLAVMVGSEMAHGVMLEDLTYHEYAHALARAESIELADRAAYRLRERIKRDT